MGIRMPAMLARAKHIYESHRNQSSVPKRHLAIYVGEMEKKRFVVPISYLNHPSFQELLQRAAEEFGFDHPTSGGLTIPCEEDVFVSLTCRLKFS